MKTKFPFKSGSPEASLWAQIDPEALPQHIAIILDGNGRWAQRRGQPRIAGHRAGVRRVREIVEFCARIHLPVLTLFAFSLDNWKRPQEETEFLMQLLRQYIRREIDYMRRNNVCLRVIGRWQELPAPVRADVAHAIDSTAANTGLQVVVALNYSGRGELVDTVRRLLVEMQKNGRVPITETTIAAHLDAADLPDPDLLIRTSGEMRISNFLLWQLAYTEIWVTETLWPDFTPRHLLEAILDFQRRERRFGGLDAGAGKSDSAPSTTPRRPVRPQPARR
jgi:undecaprenyl diphosphate synthase